MMEFEKLSLPRENPVLSLAYSATLGILAVGQMGDSADAASLSLWDISNKKSIHAMENEPYSNIRAMCFDHTGEHLAYSNNDKLFVFDVPSNRKTDIGGQNKKVNKLLSSATSPRIIMSGMHAAVYDLESEKSVWQLEGYDAYSATKDLQIEGLPSEWISAEESSGFLNEPAIVEIFKGGDNILIGGHNKGKIELIEVSSGKTLKEIFPAPIQAYWMSLGCQEKILAVSSKIPYANFIWELDSGKRILPEVFNERFGGYSTLRLHSTERWLASGSLVGFVSLQSLDDGRFIFSEQLHAGRVSQVIFSGNSKKMFSAGEDGQVNLITFE